MKNINHFCSYALISMILIFIGCKAQKEVFEPKTGEYLYETFDSESGNLNFRIYYPNGFDSSKEYPLLLFMHGAGERGSDNEAQLVHGSELIASKMEQHNAIAIFPQCPAEDYWIKMKNGGLLPDGNRDFIPDVGRPPSASLKLVVEMLENFKSKSFVDKSKIYVAGLSMGGMATFDLIWRMPTTFAAGMPICGAGSTSKAKELANTPLRIFHGEEDAVVSVQESLQMIEAISAVGGSVESFIYDGVNHDSWTNAFAEPDFIEWLFKHARE